MNRQFQRRCSLFTLLALVGGSGCSLVFVRPPPPQHVPAEQFVCTTSYTAPVLDSVVATLGGFVSFLALDPPCIDTCGDDRNLTLVAIALPLFVLPTLSAIYGTSKVTKCRIAHRQ
jgi:hypothetical protein